MCGIAGYSLAAASGVDRTLAAQALLAGIAERGADAVGYAYRAARSRVHVHKQRSGASALLDGSPSRDCATQAARPRPRLHEGPPARSPRTTTRSATAPVVGIHNGIIVNDDELLAAHGFARAEPRDDASTPRRSSPSPRARDSTARASSSCAARWRPPGSTSAQPEPLFVARGVGRPLWLGRGRDELFFASTTRRARGRRALRRHQAAQAASSRRAASSPSATARSCARERFSPDRSSSRSRFRPCAPRTRARRASQRLARARRRSAP